MLVALEEWMSIGWEQKQKNYLGGWKWEMIETAKHTTIEIERCQEIWNIRLEKTQIGVSDGADGEGRWRTKMLAYLIPTTADKKWYSGGCFK